jgi:xanthine/uracil/vitamin C permease (AzgA family)
LFCIFSATGASNLIPKAVKVSTIVGMGLQIALLGMMSVNLVVKNNSTLKKFCTGEARGFDFSNDFYSVRVLQLQWFF